MAVRPTRCASNQANRRKQYGPSSISIYVRSNNRGIVSLMGQGWNSSSKEAQSNTPFQTQAKEVSYCLEIRKSPPLPARSALVSPGNR